MKVISFAFNFFLKLINAFFTGIVLFFNNVKFIWSSTYGSFKPEQAWFISAFLIEFCSSIVSYFFCSALSSDELFINLIIDWLHSSVSSSFDFILEKSPLISSSLANFLSSHSLSCFSFSSFWTVSAFFSSSCALNVSLSFSIRSWNWRSFPDKDSICCMKSLISPSSFSDFSLLLLTVLMLFSSSIELSSITFSSSSSVLLLNA